MDHDDRILTNRWTQKLPPRRRLANAEISTKGHQPYICFAFQAKRGTLAVGRMASKASEPGMAASSGAGSCLLGHFRGGSPWRRVWAGQGGRVSQKEIPRRAFPLGSGRVQNLRWKGGHSGRPTPTPHTIQHTQWGCCHGKPRITTPRGVQSSPAKRVPIIAPPPRSWGAHEPMKVDGGVSGLKGRQRLDQVGPPTKPKGSFFFA